MKSGTEKKGFFARLAESKKAKKNSCCSFEIVEISEKNTDNNAKKQIKEEGNSCCK